MERAEVEALIKRCDFDSIIDFCKGSPENLAVVREAACRVGILEDSILGYFACLSLLRMELSPEEQAKVHNTASMVLSGGINFVAGAYRLGYYHAQMSIKLDPANTLYKKSAILTYKDIPDLEDVEIAVEDGLDLRIDLTDLT